MVITSSALPTETATTAPAMRSVSAAEPQSLVRVGSCDSLGQSTAISSGQENKETRNAGGEEEQEPCKTTLPTSDTMSGAEALVALLSSRPEKERKKPSQPAAKTARNKAPPPRRPPPVPPPQPNTKASFYVGPHPRAEPIQLPNIMAHALVPQAAAVEAANPRKRKRKEKEVAVALAPGEPMMHVLPGTGEPWQNVEVTLRNGKYKGRKAVVLGLAKKKYRVQVEGLDYQLEFYPSYVGLPVPPEGYFSQASPGKKPAAAPSHSQEQQLMSHSIAATMTKSGMSGLMELPSPPQADSSGEGGRAEEVMPHQLVKTNSMGSTSSQMSFKGSQTDPKAEAQSVEFREKHNHWVGETLSIQRGKYQGRMARILGLTSAKLQVSVPGVEHQLEYYPSMFIAPEREQARKPTLVN